MTVESVHPPQIQWISITPFLAECDIQVGWRGEDGSPAWEDHHLDQHQSSRFAINANELIRTEQAGVCLWSSGWTIYPKEEIPDVTSLWLS